jgi:hypothetical protein
MKKIQLILSVVTLVLAISVTAADKPKMNTIPISSEKAVIAISNQSPAIFEISIKSENGELVYFDKTENMASDFRKIFNFSNISDGDYKLTVNVDNKSLTKNLNISVNGISPGEIKLTYDPFFSFQDNSLKYSYINSDQNRLKLYIYSNNDMIYSKNLGNNVSVTGGLDLTRLEKGNYRVVLNSGDQNYAFNIVK